MWNQRHPQRSYVFNNISVWCKTGLGIIKQNIYSKRFPTIVSFCFITNPQAYHTSSCVTVPDLSDSPWQKNNNLQGLKIDKLVFLHAVRCLISKLTNHKLKVTSFSTTGPCFSIPKGHTAGKSPKHNQTVTQWRTNKTHHSFREYTVILVILGPGKFKTHCWFRIFTMSLKSIYYPKDFFSFCFFHRMLYLANMLF